MMFPATRAAALARLDAFLPLAGRAYAANRNSDAGPDAAGSTSRLSPAIRRRLIGEDEVVARVIEAHGFAAAEKFIQEVCWRTYWVGWLQQRPAIWTRFCGDVASLNAAMADDPGLERRYQSAIGGNTGIDCFDFWARELVTTGWLHNHARMNFASIWIFTLGLPWQLGAAFFYRHLIDACPASNTLSWRWVAGLQTPGKTYLARADIIRDRSGGRFAVAAPLARSAAPLPMDVIPPAAGIAPAAQADPALRTGLLVTTADLSLETRPLPPLVAVVAAQPTGDPAMPRHALAEAALADGLARAAAHAGVVAERLTGEAPFEALRDWAAGHRLQQLVTGEAPVGPIADRLTQLEAVLAGDGVRLVRLRRRWDDRAWPAATKGFFAFRAMIPSLVAL